MAHLSRNRYAPDRSARMPVRILMAAPRGFCAGVRRAIAAVEAALDRFGPPVYVRRAIVHNMRVVRALERRGAVFVDEVDAVPAGAVLILSAHGVARSVVAQAGARGLRLFDAVCPLVRKVHEEVARHDRDGRRVLLIGHDGHPEVVGTVGQLPSGRVLPVRDAAEAEAIGVASTEPLAFAVQTTFSTDEAEATIAAMRARFTDLVGPRSSDICYATTNRQAAAKRIAAEADAMLVAGDSLSSNAARLAEIARAAGCPAVQLVEGASEIDWSVLGRPRTIGVTAAASTPEEAVDEIVAALGARFEARIEEREAVVETARFKPLELA